MANDFETYLEQSKEYGVVTEVRHPIVVASGLPDVKTWELVAFENGQTGQVLYLNPDKVFILLLSNAPVTSGERLTRTNLTASIPVGQTLLGCVVDPLGNVIKSVSDHMPKLSERRFLDTRPRSITDRVRITKPLLTGVSLVDLLLPLGRGQRELIVGDRKTGKSSFLLSVLNTQAREGTVIIYAMIGKPTSEIKAVYEAIKESGAQANTIIVAGDPGSSCGMLYYTPFTAMTLAEYFCEQGRDVLVLLDDLTAHAKYYRELSLLARKFPGRDSYPGDIFYVHARLLERSGNFKTGAISCLPVAETLGNDFSDYIVSNLISITDGHLLFDASDFLKGHRPAINGLLSVTRVGRQTQSLLHQDVSHTLVAFLVDYERSQSFSYFGEELSDKVRQRLNRGAKLQAFFDQTITQIVPTTVQLIMTGLIWNDTFSGDPGSRLPSFRDHLVAAYLKDKEAQKLMEKIISGVTFTDLLTQVKLHSAVLNKLCGRKTT